MKAGGLSPGCDPGGRQLLLQGLMRITLVGSIFLATVAYAELHLTLTVFPRLPRWNPLLIVVGVALETMKQIEAPWLCATIRVHQIVGFGCAHYPDGTTELGRDASEKTVQKAGVPHISTGDMFRAALAAGTELGCSRSMYSVGWCRMKWLWYRRDRLT